MSFPRSPALSISIFFAFAICSSSGLVGDEKQDAADTSDVSGRVHLPDSQTPAVDADVHLLRIPGGSYTLPVKTQKTRTDAEGRYTLEGVTPGRYKIWAETPKLTTLKKKLGGEVIEVGKEGKTVAVDPITLHEGCNYRVKIVSAETGEPLPSGRVWFGWTDLPRLYRANDSGVVEIGGLGVDNWYFVAAADGHGIQFRKTPEQPLGSTTELEFRLDPGGDVAGIVQTNDGDSVEGARVSAMSTGGGMTPGYGRGMTGKDGRFVFKNLPTGVAIRVGAGKDDYTSLSQEVVIPLGKKETKITLLCNPRPYGGDCIVSAVDENGQPIAGAELQNPGNSTADNRDATTDDRGQGRLVHMYPSHRGFRVFVRAKGFITQEINVQPGTAEAPSEYKVTMLPGKVLKGRVLDPDGKPASKIRVYYNEGEHPWSLGGRVTTDHAGEFEIDGLPGQSTLTVYTPRGFAPIRDMPVTAGLEEPIEITMQLAAIVRIRAVDKESGKPIPEFNVRVRNSRERKDGEPRGSFSTSYSAQGINILGEKTEFKMENLIEGTPLQVTVSANGYESRVLPRLLAVRSDRAELLDVALEADAPEKYEVIRGRIIQRNGGPVVGAVVKLVVGKVDPLSDRARAQGDRSDNWEYYHWDIIRSGQIAGSKQCLQFLSTATDASGNFIFPRVRKDGVWLELIHLGGDVAPARYSNLRKKFPQSLKHLDFTAEATSSVTLFIDRKKWGTAHRIRLEALDFLRYPECLERPFSYDVKTLDGKQDEVKFTDLAAGDYRITIEGKPIPHGRTGFRTVTLGSYVFQLPAAEDMEGDL